MKAKQKPLKSIMMSELITKTDSNFSVIKTESPQQRQKGIMVNDVSELVSELKNKGLI